jgi:sugar lactone lactonase YvrE
MSFDRSPRSPVQSCSAWRRPRSRCIASIAVVGLAVGAAFASAVSAAPADEVEVVHEFDDPRQLPEGLALDRKGNTYVTLGPPFFTGIGYGAVLKIGPNGSRTTLAEFADGPAPAGVVVDAFGHVYFALPDPFGPPERPNVGVHRVKRGGGSERIAGTEAMVLPNGLALDRRGALFVSDSILGEIWRIPLQARLGFGERGVGPWLTHDLLTGCGQVGVNGIALYRGDLLVANSDRGLLLRVPIGRDGRPGEPVIVAGDEDCDPTEELFSLDGIAVDRRGDVYGALVMQNRLVKIDQGTGAVVELLDESDGLWNPASVAFGARWRDRDRLYITNYAVLPPIPPASLGPAVLAYDAGIPGWPFR